jgi:phosphohistidine phosphatase
MGSQTIITLMKELIFLRHAKSSWEIPVEDRNRPLLEKGMHAVVAVANHWESTFSSADALLTSPANRAFHTAAILAHTIAFPFERFHVQEELYTFATPPILEVVKSLPKDWNKVIIVGHNPALSDAADYFSVKPTPELKTADWISLTFATNNWGEISHGDPQFGTKKEALKG